MANSNNTPKHLLSKSTFMYGCQCPKRLWLHKFKPSERDELDESKQSIFQTGTNVGLLARQLFPGGVDASPETTFLYQQSVADTAKFIQEGKKIIYEAAFQFEAVLCAIDILVFKNNKWYAYEVKSTTSVKKEHEQDAALQYYVLSNCGVAIADFFIVHLNNKYIRQGAINIDQLFSKASVKKEILQMQDFIKVQLVLLKKVLQQKTAPDIAIGNQCDKPYPCDFWGYCSNELIEEPIDYGKPYINKSAIQSFLERLNYPLYFMDFETWMTAIPEQDGHWPYRQINFQFSVHVQDNPEAELKHFEYLADGTESKQEQFISELLNVLGGKGSIVVFNQTFENTRLKELKNEFPHLQDKINKVLERIVDLMQPFRKDYKLPEMEGSYSIKKVLPALVPELSYENLAIGNGGDASAAFYNLKFETDKNKITEIRKSLLEYCKLDTYAMVKILEKLKVYEND